ncbi:Metallo-hydrolase/oxidoreductase [Crucibulum laeve]|uniref:Metallo-hydrolase/oxidoreductase n=1 Tax=Crucibulum laeve TaxID=68775 RepID=A0A5C3LSR5_9AGAR|nr:Metallo-hydrolase/oxidoreductase [Crucibulum laeve]
MTSSIRVLEASPQANKSADGQRPAHWVNKEGTAFKNPWSSWREHDWRDQLYIVFQHSKQCPKPPDNMSSLIPARKPTWDFTGEDTQKIKATWMGHASFFVELPARATTSVNGTASTVRGARILFDPIFSERCSPIQWAGFKRITPPACSFEDLPEVDVVVISHDHYDHLDEPTVANFASLPRIPHFFAPLGNLKLLQSMGLPESHCHILDWWETRRVELQIPSKDQSGDKQLTENIVFELTCTPSQHNVGRNFMDRFYHPKSLWASWVVKEVLPSESPLEAKSVFFAGDTGYRAVLDGQDEDKVPVCEGFKQIGERLGPIDFAMIPIGAYMPRRYMSPIHCSPQDSVLLFKDIKAKRAVGMHWGTFVLTTEPIMDPPKILQEACERFGVKEGDFTCTDIGQTVLY